jgi:hypothetical protein
MSHKLTIMISQRSERDRYVCRPSDCAHNCRVSECFDAGISRHPERRERGTAEWILK